VTVYIFIILLRGADYVKSKPLSLQFKLHNIKIWHKSMTDLLPVAAEKWTFRRIVWATLVTLFVVFCFWLFYRFYNIAFTIFIAIVIGTVIRPLVLWMSRRHIPQIIGVALIFIIFLGFLTGFFFLLYPLIVDQSATIITSVQGYYLSLREWMLQNSNSLLTLTGSFLPEKIPSLTPLQPTGQQILASAEQVMKYISSAFKIIFTGLSFSLFVVYWTIYGPKTIQSFTNLLPKQNRESILEIITAVESKLGFFIAGQGVLCLVIGVLAMIAYSIIGLPNALVLALVAGVMEAVPMIGPILGAIPAAVIALSIEPAKLIWVIVATVVIQQLENQLLVPRIMKKAVGVNPFVSLLSIFAFSSLFGITGALMAIPIAAIIQLILDRFVFNRGSLKPETAAGRDIVSRLRFDAQNLTKGLRKQARLKKEGAPKEVKQIDKVMDEIEDITIDLDSLLAQIPTGDS
jgi:predicted PurR-regulated permease PerM